VVGGAVLRHPGKMLAEAAVEALDHAVGLRPAGLGEPVGDGARGADPGEGVVGSRVGDIGAGFPARYGARMDAELARQRGHGRRCSAGYRRGSVGWWWHWRAAEVASAGAPLGRPAQRRDGVTRTLAPMGFQGMRKSTMMPNAQPRPRTATLASIARRRRPHHREFPTGYSLAGCSPAEPASASPAVPVYVHPPLRRHQHRCPHFVSPMVVHQPLAQPAHSSPQPRPFAPIF
jgi:hypothetical protein